MSPISGYIIVNVTYFGTLHFREWAANVYVRHTSKVSIIAEVFAKVFVRLYGEGEANVCDVGDTAVRVYDRKLKNAQPSGLLSNNLREKK